MVFVCGPENIASLVLLLVRVFMFFDYNITPKDYSLPGLIQNEIFFFFLWKWSGDIGEPHWQISKPWKPWSLVMWKKKCGSLSKVQVKGISVISEVLNFQECSPAAQFSLFLPWVLQSPFIGKQSSRFHVLSQHGWFIEALEVVNDYQGTNIL